MATEANGKKTLCSASLRPARSKRGNLNHSTLEHLAQSQSYFAHDIGLQLQEENLDNHRLAPGYLAGFAAD